jgi:hypothetical protein
MPTAGSVSALRDIQNLSYTFNISTESYEGRGFDTRWGEFLNLPNPSGRTRHWGLLNL